MALFNASVVKFPVTISSRFSICSALDTVIITAPEDAIIAHV